MTMCHCGKCHPAPVGLTNAQGLAEACPDCRELHVEAREAARDGIKRLPLRFIDDRRPVPRGPFGAGR